MKKTIVLIGGGHSHAIALKLFGKEPREQVKLILISDVLKTPYSGMLPGHIAGFYSYDETHIDLVSLTKFAQAKLYLDRAIGLDLEQNQVICESKQRINFDVLSIDIGSTPNNSRIPGAAEYAIGAKPVPQLLKTWNQLLLQATEYPDSCFTICIVGGGVGGVELTLNMQSRLEKILQSRSQLEIHLFQKTAHLVPHHNAWIQYKLTDILKRRNIQLHLNTKVTEILPHQIITSSSSNDNEKSQLSLNSSSLAGDKSFNYIFLVTDASSPQWVKDSGLSLNQKGFIYVKETLQTLSHGHIFATGDIATINNHPRPKAGVFAVRQGKPLWQNLNRLVNNQPLKNYIPQKNYLSLISTGDQRAIASWGYLGWESPLLWNLKDYIDRQFMSSLKD
jgi:pyridine nucleotide-disulfide oxidoreductase family protein